jgi:hypothetical protein
MKICLSFFKKRNIGRVGLQCLWAGGFRESWKRLRKSLIPMTFKILLAILERHTRRFYIVAKPRSDGYPEISK